MSQPVGFNKIGSTAVTAQILSFLDGKSLANAEKTQKAWKEIIASRPILRIELAIARQLGNDLLRVRALSVVTVPRDDNWDWRAY